MPRVPRNKLNTSFFHIITQGINKSYIFNEENEIKYYIKLLYKIKQKFNIRLISYCIMNNHSHILLETKNISNLSQYMQSVNTRYALYYNKKHQITLTRITKKLSTKLNKIHITILWK